MLLLPSAIAARSWWLPMAGLGSGLEFQPPALTRIQAQYPCPVHGLETVVLSWGLVLASAFLSLPSGLM